MMLLTLLCLLLGQLAWAECPQPTTSEDLMRSLNGAETSFAAMNEREFEAAVSLAQAQLRCLGESLSTADAAQFHRVDAYAAFLAGQEDRVRLSFAASFGREPSYQLPRSLAPDGHPLRVAFEEARSMPPAQKAPLAAPADGSILVDGARSADYPLDRPFIVQLQRGDGSIAWTEHLQAGQALPEYERGRRGVLDFPNNDTPKAQTHPWAFVGGAALSAVSAGLLYKAAAGAEDRFMDPGPCTSEPEPCYLEDQRALRVNHGLVIGSTALGVTAVGLGVTAVVRW